MRRPLLRERVWAVAKAWSWSEAGMIDTNKELAAGDRAPRVTLCCLTCGKDCVGLSKMCYRKGKEERTCLGERQFKGRMGKWL